MYLLTTAGQVDAIEVEPQLVGEHLGGHGLAGAAGAGEQGADAEAACALGGEAPRIMHCGTMADMDRDLPKGLRSAVRARPDPANRQRVRYVAQDRLNACGIARD